MLKDNRRDYIGGADQLRSYIDHNSTANLISPPPKKKRASSPAVTANRANKKSSAANKPPPPFTQPSVELTPNTPSTENSASSSHQQRAHPKGKFVVFVLGSELAMLV